MNSGMSCVIACWICTPKPVLRLCTSHTTRKRRGRSVRGRSPFGTPKRFHMRWITRERIKVDRVACPWLIKKFVDPAAEFVFLPHDTDWQKAQDGTVFDVPGCELGHHGEDVS